MSYILRHRNENLSRLGSSQGLRKIAFDRAPSFACWLVRTGRHKTVEPPRGIGEYFLGLRPIVYQPESDSSCGYCEGGVAKAFEFIHGNLIQGKNPRQPGV